MNAARTIQRWDGALLFSTLALIAVGVVMNYSTTAALAIGEPFPPLARRHALGVIAALGLAALAAHVPLRHLERWATSMWALGVALLAATLALGTEANGAQRWLAIPGLGFSIQAAEPARLATVIAVAAVLARATPRGLVSRSLFQQIGLRVALPVGLLLLQPDFGSAVMLCAVVGVMLFAAGLPLRVLLPPALVAGAGAALYAAAVPYARARVRGFLDPWQSAHDEGFQLVQSFVAFGRGGSFGVGLGDGRQKLFYLPEAHTDFILSVIAEEAGLLGVLLVLGFFAALCWAGFRIAGRARQPFPLLLAAGCTALVVVPALCNAAVVTGLLPTTGLTLPFLSHGSNSLVCCAVAIGIVLRVGVEPAAPPQRSAGAVARRRRRRRS